MAEAEQVFFNSPLLRLEDTAHSRQERCLHALGKCRCRSHCTSRSACASYASQFDLFQLRTCIEKSKPLMNEQTKASLKFNTETQVRAYWEQHDATQRPEWSTAKKVTCPNLKPTTKTSSLRLPQNLPYSIKVVANARNVPHQFPATVWLQEKLRTH